MTNWRPLKYFCSGMPQYGLNIPASDYLEAGTRFLRTSDINERGNIADDGAVYLEDSAVGPDHRLSDGDLLLSRSGTLGRCLRYRSSLGEATFAGYLIRFRPSQENVPKFLEYCTQSSFFQQAIEAGAPSSTISNFNAERYANMFLPWWPRDRQRAIADYLDIETGRIDALITKKRRMIEVLAERYVSSVTDRINNSVSKMVQLRRVLTSLVDGPFGSSLTSAHYVDEGARVVRLGNIGVGEFLDADRAYISTDYYRVLHRHRVEEGDLLIAGLGDATNHVGESLRGTGSWLRDRKGRLLPRTSERTSGERALSGALPIKSNWRDVRRSGRARHNTNPYQSRVGEGHQSISSCTRRSGIPS